MRGLCQDTGVLPAQEEFHAVRCGTSFALQGPANTAARLALPIMPANVAGSRWGWAVGSLGLVPSRVGRSSFPSGQMPLVTRLLGLLQRWFLLFSYPPITHFRRIWRIVA